MGGQKKFSETKKKRAEKISETKKFFENKISKIQIF